MVTELFPHVTKVFTDLIDILWNIMGACGSRRIWLYAMYMMLSYRFILRPVFGWANSAGSDFSYKKRKE